MVTIFTEMFGIQTYMVNGVRTSKKSVPANYVEQQNKILAKITKQEIDAVAKKMLNPEKMYILLVGDKAKILEGIKKLGYEIIELDTDGKKVEKKAF